MKGLFIGLLVLGSISAFANEPETCNELLESSIAKSREAGKLEGEIEQILLRVPSEQEQINVKYENALRNIQLSILNMQVRDLRRDLKTNCLLR